MPVLAGFLGRVVRNDDWIRCLAPTCGHRIHTYGAVVRRSTTRDTPHPPIPPHLYGTVFCLPARRP